VRRALALAVVVALGAPAGADAADGNAFLLSRAAGGGLPNGPSRAPVFSQDRQLGSRVAFESDASDLVPDDGNGPVTDVFVAERSDWRSDGLRGLPWQRGGIRLVSRASGGAPANGRSFGADVDGDQLHDGLSGRPRGRCVAFVSEASNLVPGDTNGLPDAFIADLKTGAVTRVSVDALGRQARGATYDVQVDGGCSRVAFTSDARSLALTKATWKRAKRPPSWRPVVTTAPDPGQRQVYVRVIDPGQSLGGATFLASATGSVAANGPSYDVSLGKGDGCPSTCEGTSGLALAFTSEASNLSPRDPAGTPDVYRRTVIARPAPRAKKGAKRPASPWAAPETRTDLVSFTPSGSAGNGPSGEAAIESRGRRVAFTTAASDVLPCTSLKAGEVCDTNGVSDVAEADFGGRKARMFWVSASDAIGQPGNGASGNPVITRYGSIFFESEASNLQERPFGTRGPDDRNGARDVFYWSEQFKRVSLYSHDSEDRPRTSAAPAVQPATNAYNNYLVFATADPRVDLTLPPGPGTQQIYLRYIGPR